MNIENGQVTAGNTSLPSQRARDSVGGDRLLYVDTCSGHCQNLQGWKMWSVHFSDDLEI